MKSKLSFLRLSFWQTVTLILAVVLLVIWGVRDFGKIKGNQIEVKEITPGELRQEMSSKQFVFINVHTPYEGEIEQTDIFIDFDKMEQNKDKLPMDRTTKIILYCKTGHMSKTAASKLAELGYTNIFHLAGGTEAWEKAGYKTFNVEELKKAVVPENGFSAPIKWGNLGPTLVRLGVIDLAKFKKAVNLTGDQLALLTEGSDSPITIDSNNSQFIVDVLWALGLAQRSKIYDAGPMGKEYKKQIGNFASTGGWTLAKGAAVSYLNKYNIVNLSSSQQERIYEISQNIYRPCCSNPTSFPDCNHGMAALGLVELMVAEGYSDDDIYSAVLQFNSFWFSQSYIALAADYALKGVSWDKVDAKEALGQLYSSGQGAAKISNEVGRLPYLYKDLGGGCGV